MAVADFPVRVATDADVVSLVSLVNSAYRGNSSRVGWTTEADLVGGQRVGAVASILVGDPFPVVAREVDGAEAQA